MRQGTGNPHRHNPAQPGNREQWEQNHHAVRHPKFLFPVELRALARFAPCSLFPGAVRGEGPG